MTRPFSNARSTRLATGRSESLLSQSSTAFEVFPSGSGNSATLSSARSEARSANAGPGPRHARISSRPIMMRPFTPLILASRLNVSSALRAVVMAFTPKRSSARTEARAPLAACRPRAAPAETGPSPARASTRPLRVRLPGEGWDAGTLGRQAGRVKHPRSARFIASDERPTVPFMAGGWTPCVGVERPARTQGQVPRAPTQSASLSP